MPCGHTRLHSPQSVQRPATWNARIMWNIFSSKSSTFAFCALSNLCCQTHIYGSCMPDIRYGRHYSGYILIIRSGRMQISLPETLLQSSLLLQNDLHLWYLWIRRSAHRIPDALFLCRHGSVPALQMHKCRSFRHKLSGSSEFLHHLSSRHL